MRRKLRFKSGGGNKEAIMAVGMHKMRLGRSLASLIGEGEGSEDRKSTRLNSSHH